MKQFTINSIEYAKYCIDGSTLYLTVMKNLPGCNKQETEEILKGLIQIGV